jgi:jumonji domain-containing protein 2
MFGWHVEDLNMASINFNHYGAPKFWYHISRQDFRKFESLVKDLFPEEFIKCSQFLRHKTVFINPYLIKELRPKIKIKKTVQYPGEFIITLNSAYHSGFNCGFNIAESVNFATPDWLPEFPKYKNCKCQKNTVFIEPEFFEENLEKNPLYSNNKYFLQFKNYLDSKRKKITKTRHRNNTQKKITKF